VLARGVPASGELSDAALIARSLREPSWFAEIFRRHGIEIVRYVHARLGPVLAEDVAAETFLAAFRYRDRYDLSRLEARPWLYGIAVRQIGKHQRAETRYRRAIARLPAESVPADFGDRSIERVIAEAAQALGLTVSAVRSRLNRIRVKARKELGGANPALGVEQARDDEEITSNG
jgi:RNA polymerase sigma-70 factor (ECF subfamily)